MARPAFLHPFASPSTESFITIVSGDGAVVTDQNGKEYVDAMASLWYCNVGHGRVEIADAVALQMRRLAGFHTFEKFTNEPADELAATIASLAPMPDARVFFACSGSEAVDSAIKIARLSHASRGNPSRTVIISRAPSYHGVTYGGLSATGLPLNRAGFGPLLPDAFQIPKDDLEAARLVFERRPGQVAAVIAEPVIGAGGVYPPRPGYLEGLRALCDEHGAWLILDEVICGFGRLGHWWGAGRYGVVPDFVTFAKAITSGYQPLGGVVVGPRVLSALEAQSHEVLRHGFTYSGHPAACTAGLAAIRITREERLLEAANVIGQRLRFGLESLRGDGLLADVRGEGAMWAAGLVDSMNAAEVRDEMLRHGVIARPIGDSTITFCPPLVITDDQLDRCLSVFETALRTRAGAGAAA